MRSSLRKCVSSVTKPEETGGSPHPASLGSHGLSHVTYPFSSPEVPIIPRPRAGHRRRFGEADKRRILEEAAHSSASVSEVARRYGIDRRILCRWKQELSPPAFVTVEITDVAASATIRLRLAVVFHFVEPMRCRRYNCAGRQPKLKFHRPHIGTSARFCESSELTALWRA